VPDEQSNLNSPRRPDGNRRRGRRGGRSRSRSPRPAAENAPAEFPPAPKTIESGGEIAAPMESPETTQPEHETEPTGGFREPHPETPEGFHAHEDTPPAEPHEPEPTAEAAPAPERPREQRREQRRDDRRDDRRDERPPQPPPRIPVSQRQWVKPADFRPAEPTAITQAVEHAMFIATALKELHDQMDEVLELVEIAERQKIADERELEELRRALRRIQPQRTPPPHHPHHHQPPPRQQRREDPRQQQLPREQPEKRDEPPAVPEVEPPQTD